MNILSLDTIGKVVGIIGGVAGIIGGATGMIAFICTWLKERDHVEVRIRPIVDKQALTTGFYLEAVNLGPRKVCISFAGFICAPFKARSSHLLNALKPTTGHCCISKFPFVLEPGLLCRVLVNANEFARCKSEPIRPIVRLASQKRFLGPLIRDSASHFACGREIDPSVEDAIFQHP